MKRWINGNFIITLLFAFTLLFIWGCSNAGRDKETALSSQPPAEAEMQAEMADGGMTGKRAMSAQMSVQPASPPQASSANAFTAVSDKRLEPQIIKTATISLQVDDIKKSMRILEGLISSYQGIITNQSLSLAETGSYYRTGSLEVRIPEKRLQQFLDDLMKEGTLLNQEITGEDVSSEIIDNEARIRNLKAEEEALQGIMKRTGKVPEILEVARELARVRGETEQIQGRLNYLRQQVSYSTVNITLSEKGVSVPIETKPTIGRIIENAFKSSTGALYDLVLFVVETSVWVLIYVLPLIIILALVVTVLWKIVLKVFQTGLRRCSSFIARWCPKKSSASKDK